MSTTSIKERPIIMQAHNVRAIIEGRKTQTRRTVAVQPPPEATHAGCYRAPARPYDGEWEWLSGDPRDMDSWMAIGASFTCPYGKPGDRLWVREKWCPRSDLKLSKIQRPFYAAGDRLPPGYSWRSARYMPKRAARLWLEIADVRIERVQEISDDDAVAEGVAHPWVNGHWPWISDVETPWRHIGQADSRPTLLFSYLWDTINGKGSWDANPWVWAITFRRVEPARFSGTMTTPCTGAIDGDSDHDQVSGEAGK